MLFNWRYCKGQDKLYNYPSLHKEQHSPALSPLFLGFEAFFIKPLLNQIKTHWDQDFFHKIDLAKRGSSTCHNRKERETELTKLTFEIYKWQQFDNEWLLWQSKFKTVVIFKTQAMLTCYLFSISHGSNSCLWSLLLLTVKHISQFYRWCTWRIQREACLLLGCVIFSSHAKLNGPYL